VGSPDLDMMQFSALSDTMKDNQMAWQPIPERTVAVGNFSPTVSNPSGVQYYIYSLYQLSVPATSGSWCNSDNSSYFSAYPQTTLNIHVNQSGYDPDVFLCFKNIQSMVHVYPNSGSETNFSYLYAPFELPATIVAVAEKEGKIYASFTQIKIGNNQTYNIDLQLTNTNDFKATLRALD